MSVSILVVDDETDVGDLFRQHFRREARNGTYVMHFAYSGEEALDKLAGGIEPQLIVILSDINMPVMDGLELLREIKTRRPDLPVMMVIVYGDDERRRLAGEYGAAEFITKPVDFDLLKTQLCRAMIEALIAGESDPDALAAFAHRRIKAPVGVLREALRGRVTHHHRFLLQLHLRHIDALDDAIGVIDREVDAHVS
jgi:CheY-like chemotaxis protein